MALEQIRWLVEEDVLRVPGLADAAYGNDNGFRDGLQQLNLEYAVGVQSSTSVWPPGLAPLPAMSRGGMGRPPKLLRRMRNSNRFRSRN
jgi:SRSO17 transposase